MDLQAQLTEFVVTLSIGMILGIIFDFYRIFRSVCRPKQWLTFLGDALYWVAALIVTFACLLYSNWAQLRFYVFFGLMIGAALYYFFISRYILFSLFYFIRRISAFIRGVKKIVVCVIGQPLAYCLGLCTVPFRGVYRKLCRWRKKADKNSENT